MKPIDKDQIKYSCSDPSSCDWRNTFCEGCDKAVAKRVDIEKLPVLETLEQEPKTGHWIGHREHCENLGVMPSGLCAYEWCSNCDCGIDVREWHRNKYNFCPNCGADMREVVGE